ncbi:MAG TPA: DinB family protein, partial [Telluria sp.]|nr:DinB family protein [Telluria sp.]
MKPGEFGWDARFVHVRARSLALAAPLSAEDCGAQSMPDASPIKWHLAHTTWFFETFILERFEPVFRPCHPLFRTLFNSYYNGVGDRHPRPQRGLLTRPSLDEVLAYRADVDERMELLLAARGAEPELARLVTLGLQHEQQHQ